MIKRLSKDVRGHLRTGVALTGVAQCVEELVLNALDAGATCVAVRVDLPNFMLQVVDNGSGISADQLPLVGERYCTSKCHSVEDLDNLKYFGYRGEALASLCSAASFLEIISRPRSSAQTYTKCFHKGKPLIGQESRTPRPSSGTTVSVRDLFYNLPVRKKSLNEGLEMEKIRYRMAGLALMWPSVSFSLRDEITGNVILQTHKCSGVLNTFSFLFGGLRAKGMCEVVAENDVFKISGFVSKENYSRKDLQFVFVNRRLVLKSKVHKVLNTILGKSTLIKRRTTNTSEKTVAQNSSTGQDKSPVVEASSPTKQFERYGVFFVNIDCPFSAYDITFDPAKTLVEFHDWPEVTRLIEGMILKFLREENLLIPSEQHPEVTSGAAEDSSQDDAPAIPDTFPETEDPFDGDDEEVDEEFHIRQQQKRYADGISTYNNLNSLFSRTVRRPQLTLPSADSLLSNPSLAKKNKPNNENDVEFDKKKMHTKKNIQDVGKLHLHDETVDEMPEMPVTESVQSGHTPCVAFNPHKMYDLTEKPHGHPPQQTHKLRNNKNISERFEIGLELVLRPATDNAPASSPEQITRTRKPPEQTTSLAAVDEIRLPERFGYTSSLSRIRSELNASNSLATKPVRMSAGTPLKKFSRTRACKPFHGKHNDCSKINVHLKTKCQEEVAANAIVSSELVLPPLRRTSLYRSKSLDEPQAIGQQTQKASSTSLFRRNRSDASDDLSVKYSSIRSHQDLMFAQCNSEVQTNSSFNHTYMKPASKETKSRESVFPINVRPSEMSAALPECDNRGKGKSTKRKSSDHKDLSMIEYYGASSAFVSRKRMHSAAANINTEYCSQSSDIHKLRLGQGLSQAAKLARLVMREQDPVFDGLDDTVTFEHTGSSCLHTDVSGLSSVSHKGRIPSVIKSSFDLYNHIPHQTVSVAEDVASHAKVTVESQVPTQRDFTISQASLCLGREDPGEITFLQMPAENTQCAEDIQRASFHQPGVFEMSHAKCAEDLLSRRDKRKESDDPTIFDDAWQPSFMRSTAFFETPNTVFGRPGHSDRKEESIKIFDGESAAVKDVCSLNRNTDSCEVPDSCHRVDIDEECCGGATAEHTRHGSEAVSGRGIDPHAPPHWHASLGNFLDTHHKETMIRPHSHKRLVLLTASGDMSTQQSDVLQGSKVISSSRSQKEMNILYTTQGFPICSSQGFALRAGDFDSMPPTSTNAKETGSHTVSPISIHSAGFSPNICDPMLSDVEQSDSVSTPVPVDRNDDYESHNTYSSAISSSPTKKTEDNTRGDVLCVRRTVTTDKADGFSQELQPSLTHVEVNAIDVHDGCVPPTKLTHSILVRGSCQNSLAPEAPSYSVTTLEQSGHNASMTAMAVSQSQKSSGHTHSGYRCSVRETSCQSGKLHDEGSEEVRVTPGPTISMDDSQTVTDSEITCGQRTPQSAGSKSHNSQTQSQDSLFLFHSHPVPSTIQDSANPNSRPTDTKNSIQTACRAGPSHLVSGNGGGSLGSRVTETRNVKGNQEDSQTGMFSAGLPVILTPDPHLKKKAVERKYDLSVLRRPTPKSHNGRISTPPGSDTRDDTNFHVLSTSPERWRGISINPDSMAKVHIEMSSYKQTGMNDMNSVNSQAWEKAYWLPLSGDEDPLVNCQKWDVGKGAVKPPIHFQQTDESGAKPVVSVFEQAIDSFSDSLTDCTLAAVDMPEHLTLLHPSGSQQTDCVSVEIGVIGSIFTQNAYNLGSGCSETGSAVALPSRISSGLLESDCQIDKQSSDDQNAEGVDHKSQRCEQMKSSDIEARSFGSVAMVSASNDSSVSQKLAEMQRRAAAVRPGSSSDADTHKQAADNPAQENEGHSANMEEEHGRDGDRNTVQWIPVPDPKTGERVYVNSRSGHTLTQAQWEEMGLEQRGGVSSADHSRPSAKRTDVRELSPLSHSTLEALLEDHFEGDDEESRTKWRHGRKSLTRDPTEESGISSSLADDLLSSWNNPVFAKPDQILQVAEQKQSSRASKVAQCFLQPTAFSKQMLAGGKVIGQLDNKFVACLIQEEKTPLNSNATAGGMVVLFDQHAAHERVRLEQLTSSVYEMSASGDETARIIRRSEVSPPRTVVLLEEDVRLMQSFRQEFERIGVVFETDPSRRDTVHIHTMPACMAQREANDRKRGKDPLSFEYVETMLREHTQLLKTTAGAKRQLPQAVHRLLATHACKGAFMFL